MIKIIGLERKTGEYQGTRYDNTLVHFVTDTNTAVMGLKGSFVKVKTEKLARMLGCGINDIGIAVNRKADFHYDLSENPPVLCGIVLEPNEKK